MYESEETSGPAGAMDRLKKLVVFLVVVGLLAVAGYLQVERNRRTYFTATKEGALVISKGSYFLWGSRPYVPDDPSTAEAYAPVPVPEGTPPIPDARFDEREDLDRFLFDLLAGWAEPRIRAGDPEQMKEGFLYVERASRLNGVSGLQAKKLRELRAEVAFFEARDRLERAAGLLEEAREKLRLAADGSGHAREAILLLEQIEPANEVVAVALRRARVGFRTVEGAAPAVYPVAGAPAAAPEAAVPANGLRALAPVGNAEPALPAAPVIPASGTRDPVVAPPVGGAVGPRAQAPQAAPAAGSATAPAGN